jgi:hypothetical protein
MTPPPDDGETRLLLAYLAVPRRHVLGILEGLSEHDLHRPVLPSGWTCVALLRHLTLDVERHWFRAVFAGEQAAIDEINESAGGGWRSGTEMPGAEALALYRHETERTDAVIASSALDAPPAWWPEDVFGGWRLRDLRELILHVLVETASHAGHLDAARELIDGRQWLVLPD